MKQAALRSRFLRTSLVEMNCSPGVLPSRSVKGGGHQVISSNVDALICKHLTLSDQSSVGGWCLRRFSGKSQRQIITQNPTEMHC